MTDLFDNPMGTDGFEFVDICCCFVSCFEPPLVGPVFYMFMRMSNE